MILQDKLDSGAVIVLDGATGTEIARLGGEMNSAAWCAVANMTHPGTVRRVHEEYLRAGADVVTANTFATCRHVLEGAGLAEQTAAINRRAVELAREARDAVAPGRPVAVAGSMSTTMAWQEGSITADPRFVPSPEQEARNYREMADILAEAGAEILILEMMADLEQAPRCMEAAVATGLPVWVGISCSQRGDGRLVGWNEEIEAPHRLGPDHVPSDAPPLADIIDTLKAIGGEVFGIMHSSVETTGPGLDCLFDRWDGPVMAYPETQRFDVNTQRSAITIEPGAFAEACLGWVESGVRIIGGCCGTTIDHIRALADRMPEQAGPRKAA